MRGSAMGTLLGMAPRGAVAGRGAWVCTDVPGFGAVADVEIAAVALLPADLRLVCVPAVRVVCVPPLVLGVLMDILGSLPPRCVLPAFSFRGLVVLELIFIKWCDNKVYSLLTSSAPEGLALRPKV